MGSDSRGRGSWLSKTWADDVPLQRGFLISIFFIFVFYKNIFSIWKFTEIYPGRPAAGRPGPGRPAAGRQGLICKNNTTKNCRQIPGDRSLGSGAAGLPGRPEAGRPALFFAI